MIRLHIKLNLKATILWALILLLIVFGFMAFFPSMANDSMKELVDGKLNGLPDSILSIVGFETFPDFTDINVFYGYIMQYVMMALAVFSMSLGLNTYIKEEKEGTIEFLFAQPQSRQSLILNKLAANILLLTVVITTLVASSVLSFILFKPESINLGTLLSDNLIVFLSYYLLSFIFLLLGTSLSMLLPSSVSVIGISMALVFLPYLVGTMATMIKELKFIKGVSILHTLMPNQLYSNTINWMSLILWCLVSLALFMVAYQSFKNRDIKI